MKRTKHPDAQGLRDAAEALLPPAGPAIQEVRAEDLARLVHELQVHRIELEMQNSALQQTRSELEAALDHYTELYDFAPVGYLTLTAEGLIAQINLTGAKFLGVERGGLLRRRFADFVAPRHRTRWSEHFARLKQRDSDEVAASTELALQRANGSIVHAQANGIRTEYVRGGVAKDDEQRAAVREVHIALIDISARIEIEAQRAQLDAALQAKNVELGRARVAAEQANLAKSDFLSSMSHELRTPLGAILGFAQLIESGSPPPTALQARSIAQILKGGWYLLDLINEILDLALIESGKLSLSLEPVALAEVMLECENLIAAQAQKRRVTVRFPVFETPLVVLADRTRVKQVMLNLLSNAIKYNRVDGTVTVECAPSSPDRLRISVRDSGAGLAAEQIAELFQPFNRLGQDAKGTQGTGIGLVVSKRLIELMGGAIGVDSVAGAGCVFWVELRLTAARAAAQSAPGGAAVAADAGGEGAVRTVLYVEDNPANLMLVEDLLERRSGIRLVSASDGRRGIDLARATRPDVILMDINLPGISGTEAMKVLADDPATAHIPVIAISANAMPSDIEKGRNAGFFHYLTKPIKLDEFTAALDLALRFAPGAGQHDGGA